MNSIKSESADLESQNPAMPHLPLVEVGHFFAPSASLLLVFGVLSVIGAYWHALYRVAAAWQDPRYQFGGLIPLVVVALLWYRREPWRPTSSSRLVAIGLLLGAVVCKITLSAIRPSATLELLTLLPSLMAVFLFLAGWPAVRWAGWPLLYLGLAFPLPTRVSVWVSEQLQSLVAPLSAWALQALGFPCFREGKVIVLESVQLHIVEECSGLSMITVLLAIVLGSLFFSQRATFDRVVLILAALPIALAANIFRVVLTGICCELMWVNSQADSVARVTQIHDYAGYLMPVLALGLIALLLWGLSRMFRAVSTENIPLMH